MCAVEIDQGALLPAADDPPASEAGQSSPAGASAAAPAQPSTSTQWEGPDLTKDVTTLIVCLADGSRQVNLLPSSALLL